MTEEEVFSRAIELPEDRREGFLEGVYHDQPAKRAAMDAMLRAHLQQDSLLDLESLEATEDPPAKLPDLHTQIGNFKLLQKIGEGGFGVVYMAEQLKPVKRKVALKVIKPGMDTTAVVARFEAERQALAMMDHSHIAKVFDGGATEEGRPYFVMELVKGVPITTYCDDNKLRTAQRLKLFIDVCKAVQHAHHKGVIHRDIKPSNVMITLHDGQPVVKVIDFGVAKAMHTELTEKTLFTAYGQMIGTPQYMSPEQAELSGLDIDTRSDLYSLGVLLYELLTGTTPLESEALKKAGFVGMQRMIKETEPPKPSVRLSSSGDQLTHIAEHRSVSPDRLSREIRGDLDWIVMKALEKDRNRRYDTANGLARDIERFLAGDAVEACPPSIVYRARRFVSKNKVVVGVTGLVFAMLCAGLCVVELQRQRALANEREAIAARQESEQQRQLAVAAREEATTNLRSFQGAVTEIAFEKACNGDLEATSEALEQLRLTEADPLLIETLEGISLYTSGRLQECVAKLEGVLQREPNNRIAQACMLWASFYTGELLWHTRLSQYSFDEGGNDYERLFAAMQAAYGANDAASDSILVFDDLIAQHPDWGIARAFRSEALRYRFEFQRNLADIYQAVDDAEFATELLPASEYAKQVKMIALCTACQYGEAFPENVDSAVVKSWHSDVSLLTNYFSRKFDLFEASGRTLVYYRLTDPQRADEFEKELDQKYPTNSLKLAQWFADKDFDAILKFEFPETFYNHAFKAIVQAELGNKKDAIRWMQESSDQNSQYRASYALAGTLRLLGAEEEGIHAARRLVESGVGYGWTFYNSKFLANQISEQEYLDKAYPFAVPMAHAHYHIGLRALGNGEKTKAIEHFEAVVQTGRYGWTNFYNARAFLKRLKDPDDDFPNWIPKADRFGGE